MDPVLCQAPNHCRVEEDRDHLLPACQWVVLNFYHLAIDRSELRNWSISGLISMNLSLTSYQSEGVCVRVSQWVSERWSPQQKKLMMIFVWCDSWACLLTPSPKLHNDNSSTHRHTTHTTTHTTLSYESVCCSWWAGVISTTFPHLGQRCASA